ncbi:hypothetical protein [Bosea sp. (in: a-proteobacteria)]|uniref:hypothetical protein n=1 Tax=Bosea sp. (in: a-proteobacteria) TaxID=1871050 RepID=UPI003B3B3090
MTDATTNTPQRPDRFGFSFGIANSERRAKMAAAQADGEPFDGLTDRDIALMVERGVHAIMAGQTVRGRFLGKVDEAFVLALYIAGTAGSEDVVRLFDAIAERKVDLQRLLEVIRKHLSNVEAERERDERQRRDADAASHAKILAQTAKEKAADPER